MKIESSIYPSVTRVKVEELEIGQGLIYISTGNRVIRLSGDIFLKVWKVGGQHSSYTLNEAAELGRDIALPLSKGTTFTITI